MRRMEVRHWGSVWRCRVYCNLNLLLLPQRALWKHSHHSLHFLRALWGGPAGCWWGWGPHHWWCLCGTLAWTTVCVWWLPSGTAAGGRTCPSARARPIGWRWRRAAWTAQTSCTGNWDRSSSGWWRTCRSLTGCCRGRGDVRRWSRRLRGERWTRSQLERETKKILDMCYFLSWWHLTKCFHVLTDKQKQQNTRSHQWVIGRRVNNYKMHHRGNSYLEHTTRSVYRHTHTHIQNNVLDNDIKNRHH